ncbi:porin [Gilliamella apis]|uniref:Porin n=1 Tax=Gilliamella apis TaxID=1970738 RepID=A0A2V4DNJ7_9GAMM|nr:porin [Gilliamella apis]PXY90144.1 porin [Gilliamella apis]WLS94801.1 porin [Gilliamella apis]
MKRNLLAIAIPALLVAAGANASIEVWNKDGNKVDFNGRVKAANNITNRGNTEEGDDTSARFGMSGQTQITDSITGYGRWEYEAKAGKDSKNEVRYAFAGLNFGDLGSFDYGRNDGVLKTITAYTDVLPQFGGDAGNNAWNVLTERTKAVATYRNNNFFGLSDDLSFAIQYADNGDNSATKDRVKESKTKEAYGAVAQWKIFDTGLTVGGGYAQTAGSNSRSDSNDYDSWAFEAPGKTKTWATGIKYDNYNLYLAASYFQSKHKSQFKDVYDDKTKGFELVAQYGFDLEVGRLTPSLAYVQHKVSGRNFHHNDDDFGRNLVKYVSLGAEYAVNKNFSAIVEYKFNLLKKKDIGAENFTTDSYYDKHEDHNASKPGTKDVLGVGLIYQF